LSQLPSKRCPQCGPFLSLVYADAEAYVSYSHHNKPGTIPLAHGTAVEHGCLCVPKTLSELMT